MVREVGFEPTNPYGTGASGLRVQDPHSRRVSLTWLGNTSRPIDKADSRKHQARSRKSPNPNDAPNWLSPIRQSIKSGQRLIEPRPGTPSQPYLSKLTGKKCPHGHPAQKNTTPTRQPLPRLGTIRTTPRQRNARRTRQRRMETPPLEQRHTLRLGDRKNRLHTHQPKTPTNHQHRPAQPEPPNTIRTRQDKSRWEPGRSRPWPNRLLQTARQRKSHTTPQNHRRTMHRESSQQNFTGRRRSCTPQTRPSQ